MPKKLTTEEFIYRSSAIHGGKYDYSKSEYSIDSVKVAIICHTHGVFYQTPNNHMQGAGGPQCASDVRKRAISGDASTFIRSAKNTHGDRYVYSSVKYVNAKTKVAIACPAHGVFFQTPSNHLNGKGCAKCGVEASSSAHRLHIDKFVERANATHHGKYDYSVTKYISSSSKVSVRCPAHGVFRQKASHHLNGVGCPGCAKHGFDQTATGYLYVLRSTCGEYIKIGVTNRHEQRLRQLKRETPFDFHRIELVSGPGAEIALAEKEILRRTISAGFAPSFNGATEWRKWTSEIHGMLHDVMAVIGQTRQTSARMAHN